jgi:predicted phage tail protein
MTNVYLYGELRNKFGEEFKFNINSAKEALLAINANKKGFLDEIKKLAMKGVHYRMVIDDEVVQHPKEAEIQKAPNEIHIVPIVWGAGKNGMAIGMIVLGAVLVVATGGLAAIGGPAAMGAFAAGGSLAGVASTVAMIGASIAIQGVMSLLTPKPKADFNQEVQAGGKSYLFGNKPANTSQGQAVPVGYGRLKIGSSQISASTDHYALATDIKQLMTPVDKPINEYVELVADDEAAPAGAVEDMFSTNQAVDMDDTTTFYTVNVLNSYIDIVTNSADKVFSNPVEVVVRKNGDIVSNPDLTTYDDNISYEWEELSNDSSKGKVKIENPYTVKSGLLVRSYHIPDFTVQSIFTGLKSSQTGYFQKYSQGDLVKFGPSQFNNLKFATWDTGYNYFSGELVNYPTGSPATDTYFQAIVSTGFSGQLPTGAGNTINSTWWRKILPPNLEYLYKCVPANGVSGHLPTTGEIAGGAPVAESTFWTRVETPTTTAEMDTLFSDYPAYEDKNQYTYVDAIDNVYEGKINGTTANIDNYGMEFLGYFYVPTVGGDGKSFIKDVFEVGTGTGLYEIIKIGDTGQWSGLGFTGLGGTAIPPRIGSTFYKNQTQGTGNGKIMPVGAYEFKLDSDDASDLYIDSTLASAYYSGHAMFSGFANPPWISQPSSAEISGLHSSTTTLYLTAGYHRLLARLQDLRGSEGISLYYRYDTNRDGVFSDWQLVPKEKLFHSVSDLTTPKTQKFSDIGKRALIVGATVAGERYKIKTVGTTNWTSIGSAIAQVGAVFERNSTAISGSSLQQVVEDFITYSEQKSAESNRIARFISERPLVKGQRTTGYSFYKARYRCKVTVNNRDIYYSAPVKVNINFLSTPTRFRGVSTPELSQAVQTA